MKPNLFKFAPKELSQDAFLCWFISWADPAYKSLNLELHELSRYFVLTVLRKNFLVLPDKYKINIKTQYKKIDILVQIESEKENIIFIIEDKVSSGEHNNQLIRYKNIIEEKFPNNKIILVYLKSDLVFRNEIINVKKSSYHLIEIHEFYMLMGKNKIDNDIFNDFKDNLEKKVNGYNIYILYEKWKDSQWYSLAREVNYNISESQFGSYHLGSTWWLIICWSNIDELKGIDISIEISNRKKLLIKIHSEDGILNKEIQEDIIKQILPSLVNHGAIKAKNIRGKKHRTILEFPHFIQLNEIGIINLQETLLFINNVTKSFKKYLKSKA